MGCKYRPADHTEDPCFPVEGPGIETLHILKSSLNLVL